MADGVGLIILGIVLAVVGFLLRALIAEAIVRTIGYILGIVGLVVFVIGIILLLVGIIA